MVEKRKSAQRRENLPPLGCCRVESVVGIDERGQLVLPKDVRERAHIRAGDKLALISYEAEGSTRPACLLLVKTDDLTRLITQFLGPIAQGIARS